MRQVYWLLDVEVGGAVYRWASTALEVPDGSDVLTYEPGLVAPSEVVVGAQRLSVQVTDPSVEWPSVALRMLGRPATLRRWSEGDDLSLALVIIYGRVAVPLSHGTPDEPISFDIATSTTETRGSQVPPETYRIGLATLRVSDESISTDAGKYYPILFGSPGDVNRRFTFGGGAFSSTYQPVACMPVPIISRQNPSFNTVVALFAGVNSNATQDPRLRNDTLDANATPTPATLTDFLGNKITIASTGIVSALNPATIDERAEFYAGFFVGSGGVHLTLWQAIEYLLREWGGDTDWSRMSQAEASLQLLSADTWIDDPIRDPWVWIESVIDALPFEVRAGPRGLYLEETRWAPDGSRYVRDIEHDVDAVRVGSRSFLSPGYSEFTALCRPGRDDYLGRIVYTGSRMVTAPGVDEPVGRDEEFLQVIHDSRCQEALDRYGVTRQADRIELDWTWDLATAAQVLEWRVQRDAVPMWESEYWIDDGHLLSVGDEVRLTDADMGLTDELAVVMAPPIVTLDRWSRVLLRYRAR